MIRTSGRPLGPRPRLTPGPGQGDDREHERADQQPSERQRARIHGAAEGPDHHERRGPQHHRDQRGDQRQPPPLSGGRVDVGVDVGAWSRWSAPAGDADRHGSSLAASKRKNKQILLHQSSVALYGPVMLDVHRLRVFRSVVASGSIQAAASNLGYTPSAVSQHVSALQRETGLALITRVGRGIETTAAGRALALEIDGVLSRLGEVESVVGDLRAGRTGSLSIAYFASVGSAWMPEVVATMMAEFPDVRLDLALREDVPTDPAERSGPADRGRAELNPSARTGRQAPARRPLRRGTAGRPPAGAARPARSRRARR